jgi:hypothetical protein
VTVLSKKQAEQMLVNIGAPATQCDGCGAHFKIDEPLRAPYGPFTVFLCAFCYRRFRLGQKRKAAQDAARDR